VSVNTAPFTFADLKAILVERVGLDEDSIVEDPDATFEELGLDSLAFVEIQLAMQQQYDITIPEEATQQIKTVGPAIDYVNRLIQEKGEES
jgi:acyl carrier protein